MLPYFCLHKNIILKVRFIKKKLLKRELRQTWRLQFHGVIKVYTLPDLFAINTQNVIKRLLKFTPAHINEGNSTDEKHVFI